MSTNPEGKSDQVPYQDKHEAVAAEVATEVATGLLDGHVEEWNNDPIDDLELTITDPPTWSEVRDNRSTINDILAALRNSGIIPE